MRPGPKILSVQTIGHSNHAIAGAEPTPDERILTAESLAEEYLTSPRSKNWARLAE